TTVARSSAPNARRSSAKPMAPITISAASITSALRNSLASKMTQPRPQSEAAIISAPITAMNARTSAWRKPAMMKAEAPGTQPCQPPLQEQRPLVGPHPAASAQPQRIDRAHARPGIEQHREQGRIEYDQDRDGVAEAEPENEHRHPGERRDRHERARERQHEAF